MPAFGHRQRGYDRLCLSERRIWYRWEWICAKRGRKKARIFFACEWHFDGFRDPNGSLRLELLGGWIRLR